MRRHWRHLLTAVAAVLAALVATTTLVPASPAAAAALTEVTGFGTNPTGIRMYLYVPDHPAAKPAVLVAVHYCTGSGPAFYSGTEFKSLADQYGFIVIYPSTVRTGNCWDVSSAGALTHNGTSDPVGISSMVKYVQQRYATDPARTFVTGASSGGMMTNVLLADYPDMFAAGAAFMGVPDTCFQATAGNPADPSQQAGWNSACANGQVARTPAQWGDAVRNSYPGYTGTRPRMQLWHGTADTTLNYNNFGEEIKQWTNVLGVSQTPVRTDTPQSGWTRTYYGNSSAQPPVQAISIAGVGHSLPMSGQARMAITFFGLDNNPVPPSSPPVSPPPSSPPPSSQPPLPSGCTASIALNSWTGGYVATVTVTAGSSAINGWTVATTLPAGSAVTNSWSTTGSGTTGAVSFTNVGYNGSVAAGQKTQFGFQGTGSGPTSATCSAR
ncbi:esterase [Actinoplanes sp. SE50]|uniref:extracellular catalytic domain type 1 short-chain-length polyhydroxyalkanoate depolymerase n=1 Tax=unclassified Actinoplanes TaxID=2626549 RepID=UPI00023EC885|nr:MULTISPECIES: PHB depolymerase family esterase [unclassified Actinoplanes]AEV87645.1 PHB depolymerase family esterase [Actinoplanes sp. SE50/110]ATO86048.1 esterase [Actinoplanes sp. SE50]SLM03462.1 esterase [Actinoplanes sp. SE50/110]